QPSPSGEQGSPAGQPGPTEEQKPEGAQRAEAGQPVEQGSSPEQTTLTMRGTVSPDGTLVADDGRTYTIDRDNEVGAGLIEMADRKVEVKGTVSEKDGGRVFTVTEFEKIE
ncbi:MAG: hypothetical protein JW821_13935, partial [Deltaproteobacteria bacterium]|nr:hypothetical protein [Deltaproteobacteria bacterium]